MLLLRERATHTQSNLLFHVTYTIACLHGFPGTWDMGAWAEGRLHKKTRCVLCRLTSPCNSHLARLRGKAGPQQPHEEKWGLGRMGFWEKVRKVVLFPNLGSRESAYRVGKRHGPWLAYLGSLGGSPEKQQLKRSRVRQARQVEVALGLFSYIPCSRLPCICADEPICAGSCRNFTLSIHC